MKAGLTLKGAQLPVPILKASLALNSYIMALPHEELKEYLNKVYSENPLLEEKEKKVSFDIKKNEIFKEAEKKEKYLNNIAIEKSSSYHQTKFKSPHDVMTETLKEKKSFNDFFEEQVNFNFSGDVEKKNIAYFFLSLMDESGFISREKVELAQHKFGKLASDVLKVIKTFSPTGIGAEDIKECLSIQLKMQVNQLQDDENDFSLEEKIIEEHYQLFLKKDEKAIAKILKLPLTAVEQAIKKISFLEFNPKRNYFNEITFIYPEIKVREVKRKFVLIINDEEIPEIIYNDKYYKEIINQGNNGKNVKNKEFINFINEKKIEAKNIVFALRSRTTNLIKLISYLLNLQKDFFLLGKRYLKPDTITNAAEQLDLDMSSVSRLVKQKYIDTKWGILPLKFFFSSRNILLEGEKNATRNISSQEIKIAIMDMIKSSKIPLSDQKITDSLNRKGMPVSRRTVNKYRNKMNLLSSYKR